MLLRKLLFTFIFLTITKIIAAEILTVDVLNPGHLKTSFKINPTFIQKVKITGEIDARDFRFMRDDMKALSYLDLSDVHINEYKGKEGTFNKKSGDWIVSDNDYYAEYAEDYIPIEAFAILRNNSVSKYFEGKFSLKEVILPTRLKGIESKGFYLNNIERFQISPLSEYLTEDKGFIYDKNKTKLILIPGSFCGEASLPATLEEISESVEAVRFSLLELNSLNPPLIKCNPKFSANAVKVSSVLNYSNSDWNRYNLIEKWNNINVTVTEEGTLANTIANSTEISPSIINEIKISGPINDEDIKILNRMTNLMFIDLENAQIDVIPEKAFYNKTSLCKIVLPKSLNSIDWTAFCNTSLMGRIKLPEGLNSIGSYAFQGTFINYCDFPNSLKSIGPYAFNQTLLKEVDLSNCENVYKIESYCFNKCNLLSELKLAPNTISISKYSFYNCPIKTLILPESLISIDDYAFSGISITDLVLTENIEEIGSSFSDCLSLTNIDFSNAKNLKTIGISAFYNVPSIENLDLSYCNNLKSLGASAFTNYTPSFIITPAPPVYELNLKSVKLPSSIEYIGNAAFKNTYKLSDINLKDLGALKEIGTNAFYGSAFSEIYLTNNVKINKGSFSKCVNLKSITTQSSIPQIIENSVFDGIDLSQVELLVPNGSRINYLFEEVWKEFVNIKEAGFSVNIINESICPVYAISMGSIDGAGLYKNNETITLKANPGNHYKFINWQDENGNILSSDINYTIKVDKNIALKVLFDNDENNPISGDIDFNIIGKKGEFITIESGRDINMDSYYDLKVDWGDNIIKTYSFNKNSWEIKAIENCLTIDNPRIRVWGMDDKFYFTLNKYNETNKNIEIQKVKINKALELQSLDLSDTNLSDIEVNAAPKLSWIGIYGSNLSMDQIYSINKYMTSSYDDEIILYKDICNDIVRKDEIINLEKYLLNNELEENIITLHYYYDNIQPILGVDYEIIDNKKLKLLKESDSFSYIKIRNTLMPYIEIRSNDFFVNTMLNIDSQEIKSDIKVLKYDSKSIKLIIPENIIAGHISIYNIGGKLIKELTSTDSVIDIDCENLTPGIYIIQYRKNNSVHKVKFAL